MTESTSIRETPLRIRQDLRLLFEAREACEQPHPILLAALATVLCGLPLPLPLPLMRIFHGRPKAWDLAAFVTYRCYAASSPSVVPWEGLRQMLGSTDSNERQLRRTLAEDLAEIKAVLPDLPASFLPGRQGLAAGPWRPVQPVQAVLVGPTATPRG
jgi:hypothetical protein